jgi:predicted  nucleic acid-binding Zn-ribbon protein
MFLQKFRLQLNRIEVNQHTIMAQLDDLQADLAQLKNELDAAKERAAQTSSKLVTVQKSLDDLKSNPPAAGPDLTAAIAQVQADIAEAQTIGEPPAAAPVPAA